MSDRGARACCGLLLEGAWAGYVKPVLLVPPLRGHDAGER